MMSHFFQRLRFVALFSTFFLCLFSLKGQNLQWAKGFGSPTSLDGAGQGIARDSSGNIYVVGMFDGTLDFDHGPGVSNATAVGGDDVFVLKTDDYGNFLWVKTFGSNLDEIATSIAIDKAGNIFVAGSFANSTDFDPGLGTHVVNTNATSSIFLWKCNSSGDFLNVNTYGPTGTNIGNSLAIDLNGHVIMTGTFSGTIDFDPGPGVSNLTGGGSPGDVFIQKSDSTGNFIWAKRVGSIFSIDAGKEVTTDALGNVIVEGEFSGNVDFDPNAGTSFITTVGQSDVFVLKLDPNGNFLWARTLGSTTFDRAGGVAVNASDKIISIGSFTGTVDLDTGPGALSVTSNGGPDIFIHCLEANGNFVWGKALGGSATDFMGGVGIDSMNNVYTTGGFIGLVDFDPSPNSTQNLYAATPEYDVFVSCLDSNGNYVWAKKFGSSLQEFGYAINVFADGSTLTTGEYYASGDFDPGPPIYYIQPPGFYYKPYVLKLGACLTSRSILQVIDCDSFVYANTTYTASGNYDRVFTNYIGCDSFVTLQLTIRQSSASSVSIDTCDQFYFNGLIYTNSGTYTQVIPNHQGCDSVITLNLTLRSGTAFTITDSSCGAYILNGQTYTSSGTYLQTLPNAAGCDSLVTLHLTVLETIHSQTVQACDSFLFDGQMIDSSGTYSATYPNVFGCDSIEVINLQLFHADPSVMQNGNTLSALQSGAMYQWVDCNNNYSPITGATSQTFSPSLSGNYAVEVSIGPCIARSTCTNITVVGNEPAFGKQVSCYPNPSGGPIVIDFGTVIETCNLSMHNVHGQLLQRARFENVRKLNWMLPEAEGVYFLTLYDGLNSKVLKLIRY